MHLSHADLDPVLLKKKFKAWIEICFVPGLRTVFSSTWVVSRTMTMTGSMSDCVCWAGAGGQCSVLPGGWAGWSRLDAAQPLHRLCALQRPPLCPPPLQHSSSEPTGVPHRNVKSSMTINFGILHCSTLRPFNTAHYPAFVLPMPWYAARQCLALTQSDMYASLAVRQYLVWRIGMDLYNLL